MSSLVMFTVVKSHHYLQHVFLSFCTSVPMEQPGSHWMNVCEINIGKAAVQKTLTVLGGRQKNV